MSLRRDPLQHARAAPLVIILISRNNQPDSSGACPNNLDCIIVSLPKYSRQKKVTYVTFLPSQPPQRETMKFQTKTNQRYKKKEKRIFILWGVFLDLEYLYLTNLMTS